MYAHAYANNDIAFLFWSYDEKLTGCLGFSIERTDTKAGTTTILPAWVGFENQKNEKWKPKDTSIWPVQKFNWRDFTADRGKTYTYQVIPMVGSPGNLKKIADKKLWIKTNSVTLTPGTGPIRAYFNRGILSTQSVSHATDGPNHQPSSAKLLKAIETPGNKLRESLMGQIKDAVLEIVEEVKNNGGECYAALYELNDPELIDGLISISDKLHLVLSNADANGDGQTKKNVKEKSSRQQMHDAKIDVTDRILGNGHIGHNKFLVYVDKHGNPQKVLSGSTNWTYTGLCAQTNNAILIESPELASAYLDYWKRLKADAAQQSADFRNGNNSLRKESAGNTSIDLWFSPNTKQKTKPAKNPGQPGDMKEVFALMDAAKKSIQFLAFQPGSPSILQHAASIQNKNPHLFIRGAATDPKAIKEYNTSLVNNESKKHDVVKSPTAVAASNIKDQFAYWEAELLKSSNFAHAIIHDKIVVIDAYGDNPVVITGSHNLGYKASYCNDENMLIIKGNKELATAYSVHVMDVYDHYRWRYILQTSKSKKDAYHGLKTTDKWQDYYFKNSGKQKPAKAKKVSTGKAPALKILPSKKNAKHNTAKVKIRK